MQLWSQIEDLYTMVSWSNIEKQTTNQRMLRPLSNSWQNPLFPSLGWRNWLRYWIEFPMKLTLMMAWNGADQRRSKSICQKKPQGKTRKYCWSFGPSLVRYYQTWHSHVIWWHWHKFHVFPRLARDMPEITDKETVKDLLRAKTDLNCSRMSCLHDKPIAKLLNTFL